MSDRIVVTGFGPFGSHQKNASWSAVQLLPQIWNEIGPSIKNVELIVEEIPVDYQFVQESVSLSRWNSKGTKNISAIIHVGVSSQAQGIVLEEVACNEGYQRGDVCNKVPDCNKCYINCNDQILTTKFETEKMKEKLLNEEWNDLAISTSRDAGRYLCEFVYYKSLTLTGGASLFIHVPPLSETHTDLKLAKGICIIVKEALNQIKSK